MVFSLKSNYFLSAQIATVGREWMHEIEMHLQSGMFNLGMLRNSVFDIFQHKVESLQKAQ